MAGRSIGPFEILGNLGSGAHSSILHIRCKSDGKYYALKVVDIADADEKKYLDQAQHEFRVGQMLEHPNLIKIHALELKRDWLFRVRKVHMLIEYVDGKTLDGVRLSMPRLVQVFAHVASALVHMHRRGVYHADLKPGNIMLAKRGQVKILDYGLAWIKGEKKDRVQGTPEYMAPEQVQKSIVNSKTDLYNFGATMYRLVTYKLPPSSMVGTTGSRTLDVHNFKQQLKPVKELNPQAPRKLCDIIHQCLSYRHQERPERVGDVKVVLDELAAKLTRSEEDRLETLEW